MPLAALPVTAWRLIAHHISDSAPDLLMLSRLSITLKNICRPFLFTHFELVHGHSALLSPVYPWHSLLMLILDGYVDALFVYDFWCVRYTPEAQFTPTETTRPALALEDCNAGAVAHYDVLYRNAASQSMPEDIIEEAVYQFNAGADDAALAVLLPLCRRIKYIDISPSDMPLLEAVFLDITDKYKTLDITGAHARRHAKQVLDMDRKHADDAIKRRYARQDTGLPFAELLLFWSGEPYSFVNSALVHFLPFLGLPSLHRIVLGDQRRTSGARLTWPPGVLCQCPEIYFARSSLNRETLTDFIAGIGGDCDIKQWYMIHRHEEGLDPYEPEWDHALITYDETGRKHVNIRMERYCDSGEHVFPWIVAIHHGMMCSWRHWDDEMKAISYEEADEWIGGPL